MLPLWLWWIPMMQAMPVVCMAAAVAMIPLLDKPE